MKYWKIDTTNFLLKNYEYIKQETKPTTLTGYYEISKEEYDLFKTHRSKAVMPDNIKALGGLDPQRVQWCKDELEKIITKKEGNTGALSSNISNINAILLIMFKKCAEDGVGSLNNSDVNYFEAFSIVQKSMIENGEKDNLDVFDQAIMLTVLKHISVQKDDRNVWKNLYLELEKTIDELALIDPIGDYPKALKALFTQIDSKPTIDTTKINPDDLIGSGA